MLGPYMEEPPNGYFSERMIIDQEILGSLFSDQPIRGTSLVELEDDQFGTITQTPSIPGFGDLQRVLVNLAFNRDANLMLAVYWGVASSHIRFQRSRCV